MSIHTSPMFSHARYEPVRPDWVPAEAVAIWYEAHCLWVWRNELKEFEIKEAYSLSVNPENPVYRDWAAMSNVSAEEKREIIRLAAETKLGL